MSSEAFISNSAFQRVCDLAARVGSRPDGPGLVRLLGEAVENLGATSGYYASVVYEGELVVSQRLLLACSPTWGLVLERLACEGNDPWLRHASTTLEPFCGSQLARGPCERSMLEQAAGHGFRSALAIPLPASGGTPRRVARLGLLVLGSRAAGRFERGDTLGFRILARALAMELHESYGALLCRERTRADAISRSDVELLRMDRAGLTTKEIARDLRKTPHAIDNKFYRLGVKLGVRDRHSALRIAVEFGLI